MIAFYIHIMVNNKSGSFDLLLNWKLTIGGAILQEQEFLERADEELEKVNRFYAAQEGELLARGDALIEQLRILSDIKRILADHAAASRRGGGRRPLGRAASMPPPSHSPSVNGSSGRHLLLSGLASPQSMSGRSNRPSGT
jgi:hypothetical protein